MSNNQLYNSAMFTLVSAKGSGGGRRRGMFDDLLHQLVHSSRRSNLSRNTEIMSPNQTALDNAILSAFEILIWDRSSSGSVRRRLELLVEGDPRQRVFRNLIDVDPQFRQVFGNTARRGNDAAYQYLKRIYRKFVVDGNEMPVAPSDIEFEDVDEGSNETLSAPNSNRRRRSSIIDLMTKLFQIV